jgi:pyridoxine/pyridoxamine 5'-phosphate oxidase
MIVEERETDRDDAMSEDAVRRAVELAQEVGHVLVATTDARGQPHLAAAGSVGLDDRGRLTVGEWFCPGTVANLDENRRVSIVVWKAATDEGHQLLGEVEEVKELAVMDGYAPDLEEAQPAPQVERQLVIRVDTVLDFRRAPHSDTEE